MSADSMTTPLPAAPTNDPEAPLSELAKNYPEVDYRAWAVDREWLNDQQSQGALRAHAGKVVAVYNQQVVGVGDNYVDMLLDLSPKFNVHPGRIVVVYLDEGESGPSDPHPDDPQMTVQPAPFSEFDYSSPIQTQVAELRELEKQFPAPIWDKVRVDWTWLYAQFGTAPMEPYLEQFVAIYNKQVVGSDPRDELALRIRLARQYQLHPERFVISFYG